MADKLMYIPNENKQNCPLEFKCQGNKLNDQTNPNLLKFPKLLSKRIRKRYYKTSGDQCYKQPIDPPLSLCNLLLTIPEEETKTSRDEQELGVGGTEQIHYRHRTC